MRARHPRSSVTILDSFCRATSWRNANIRAEVLDNGNGRKARTLTTDRREQLVTAVLDHVRGVYDIPITQEGILPEAEDGIDVLLRTASADLVLISIREGASEQDLGFELATIEYLGRRGFPVPRLCKTADGSLCTLFGTTPVLVFFLRDGKRPDPEDPLAWSSVGRWLASYHLAVCGFSPERRRNYAEFAEIAEVGRLTKTLRELGYDDFLADIAAFRARDLPSLADRAQQLPSGVIHGGIFPRQVLQIDGTLTCLLGHSHAYCGTFVRDIAETLVGWTMLDKAIQTSAGVTVEVVSLHPRREVLAALLASYCKTRPLSRLERESVGPSMLLACISAAARELIEGIRIGRPLKSSQESRMYRRYRVLRETVDDLMTATGD